MLSYIWRIIWYQRIVDEVIYGGLSLDLSIISKVKTKKSKKKKSQKTKQNKTKQNKNQNMHEVVCYMSSRGLLKLSPIRRRSDYIIRFIAPAIGPNKLKKFTRVIAPAHNIRGKVWMKKQRTCLHRQTVIICEAMCVVFHSNFAAYIVCRRYKPCEFLRFVWTDYWGNKSNYVITSPANKQ